MKHINIEAWVNQDTEIPPKDFRQAVHTILHAIAHSQKLRRVMILKGGILISILHKGERFTKDIDFSTEQIYQEFNELVFIEELKKQLIRSVNGLGYDLDCRLQSHKVQPSNQPDATFPSLKLKIGYAYKGSRQHKRLQLLKSTHIIPIDLNFNEATKKIVQINFSDEGSILVYSLTDLIAEKYRAILQQEIRKRVRRQDAFDLYKLFQIYPTLSDVDKMDILQSLQLKAESRHLKIDNHSMDNPNIRHRCEKEYLNLKSEIMGALPSFDEVFFKVNEFYKSLPW